jgi:hypothetical protein
VYKTVLSGKPMGENLNAPNLYAVLTIMSFFMLVPLSLAVESPAVIQAAWATATKASSSLELVKMMSLSGFFYYL